MKPKAKFVSDSKPKETCLDISHTYGSHILRPKAALLFNFSISIVTVTNLTQAYVYPAIHKQNQLEGRPKTDLHQKLTYTYDSWTRTSEC